MNFTYPIRHLSISIARPFALVNEFLSHPENFQKWASGLGAGFKKVGAQWIVEGPEGPVEVDFTPPNPYGVADHVVRVSPEVKILIPLRVLSNNDGSEVVLTLFRLPSMDEGKFATDAEWVMKDLQKLKSVLEN